MRHRVGGKKLGKTADHKLAMLRTMATDFLDHGSVTTTLPKAKVLRPFAEKLITLGKEETLHARRQAASLIRRKEIVQKLFSEIGGRFAGRPGGYTRIIKLGPRGNDGAEMALIEMIGSEFKPKEAPKKKEKKKE